MSWPKVKLSSVCEINIGKTPARANSSYWGTGQPWLSIADMKQGRNLKRTKEEITDKAITETKIKRVAKGTVLFSFKLSIGKVGIAQRDLYTNEAIAAFPIKNPSILCEEYLIYALTKMDAMKTTDRAVMGATLNKKKLAKLEIPLPSLNEQKRIAAILDKADALRRKREKAIALTDDLLRATFLDMFGNPLKNPKEWSVNSLGKITTKIGSGATPKGGKAAYRQDGISLIRSLNVHDNAFKLKNLAFISDEQAQKLKNVVVEEDDVLLNITGASVCRCTIVDKAVLPARVNQHVAILRSNVQVLNPLFLMHLLISKPFKSKLLNMAGAGGATREALTKEHLVELKIICPPIDIQNEFSEIARSIYRITQNESSSKDSISSLSGSLTQRAFRGEL